ncbi:MAG TPA: glycosyltransferase family 4 protein [Anaerolineae bacterium]|nr:glycosyltransferase family 4 protein [Anaerolineae bacterium]
MRVALIGDYPLNSGQVRGGVQAAFMYLVRELCRIEGVQVHVLTQGRPDQRLPLPADRPGPIVHILPPFPRLEFARNFKTYQARLNGALAQIRPEVVHAQGGTDDAYVTLRSGYPAAITVHGVHSEDGKYSRTFRLRLRNYLYSAIVERYVIRRVRHLIALSRYVTRYYAPHLKRDVRVYYVPNAIDEAFFNLPDAPDNPTVLFAGRLIFRKRALDVVRAFARIAPHAPHAQLRLAGDTRTEPGYTQAIRAFIQEANLADRVHLLGALSEAEVLQEFAACTLLALPSAQETTPMVIAQAMAAGKPVVATAVGGVAEMMCDGETGLLVDVGDIDGLAQALLRVLQEASLRARLGQAGRAFAVENYRADSVARRTHAVYQSIITGGA